MMEVESEPAGDDPMQGKPAGIYRRLNGTAQEWTGSAWANHWFDLAEATGVEPDPSAPAPILSSSASVSGSPSAPPPQLRPRPSQAGRGIAAPLRAPVTADGAALTVRRRGRGELTWTWIAFALAILGCGDVRLALAAGFFIQLLTVVLLVMVVMRLAAVWLWVLVPVLVLRGPVGPGFLTYASQPVSSTLGVLTALALLWLIIAGGPGRRR